MQVVSVQKPAPLSLLRHFAAQYKSLVIIIISTLMNESLTSRVLMSVPNMLYPIIEGGGVDGGLIFSHFVFLDICNKCSFFQPAGNARLSIKERIAS